jgi:hypothetical protein
MRKRRTRSAAKNTSRGMWRCFTSSRSTTTRFRVRLQGAWPCVTPPAPATARPRPPKKPLTSHGYILDVVALVLPAATAVAVKAVVDITVDWLRGLVEKPVREKTIQIYGPDGESLRAIRLRRDSEPEVFSRPWPSGPQLPRFRRPRSPHHLGGFRRLSVAYNAVAGIPSGGARRTSCACWQVMCRRRGAPRPPRTGASFRPPGRCRARSVDPGCEHRERVECRALLAVVAEQLKVWLSAAHGAAHVSSDRRQPTETLRVAGQGGGRDRQRHVLLTRELGDLLRDPAMDAQALDGAH